MNIHLVDGTYELFRFFHVVPSAPDLAGQNVGAVRGVLASLLGMIERGVTHIGVATDHVVESFRNAMWPGYKTGEGIEPELASQFPILEEALRAMGIVVWPMTEFEADDALASAAAKANADPRVVRVIICTPDKDLSQCVSGTRVLQLDRRANVVRNAKDIEKKFGVPPESIPDYLALVGDSSDGYPGLPGWGAKSASSVLARYRHLEQIPDDASGWDVSVRGAAKLAATLAEYRELAGLFRDLATLRTSVPVFECVDELEWRGPDAAWPAMCDRLGTPGLVRKTDHLVTSRGGR